jgi:hypothetical protein
MRSDIALLGAGSRGENGCSGDYEYIIYIYIIYIIYIFYVYTYYIYYIHLYILYIISYLYLYIHIYTWAKETYYMSKRDLLYEQKRPTILPSYVREAPPCKQRGPDQQGLPHYKKPCILANRRRQLGVMVLAGLCPFAKRWLFLPPVQASEGLSSV